jgi:hypothetical protein
MQQACEMQRRWGGGSNQLETLQHLCLLVTWSFDTKLGRWTAQLQANCKCTMTNAVQCCAVVWVGVLVHPAGWHCDDAMPRLARRTAVQASV